MLHWCSYGISNQRSLNTNKQNIETPHWPFVRGIHWWLVDSPTKGQWWGKCVHVITSSFEWQYTVYPILCAHHFVVFCLAMVIGIDYDMVCAGVVCATTPGTARVGPAVARPRWPAPRVLCQEWQHKPRQRRPYEWSISILPRKRSNTQR